MSRLKLSTGIPQPRERECAVHAPNMEVWGQAISFSYTDSKRIQKHLFSKYSAYVEEDDKKLKYRLKYAIKVCCFPHYCGVLSTWLYLARMVPASDV